jgi:hypothetical protein
MAQEIQITDAVRVWGIHVGPYAEPTALQPSSS